MYALENVFPIKIQRIFKIMEFNNKFTCLNKVFDSWCKYEKEIKNKFEKEIFKIIIY